MAADRTTVCSIVPQLRSSTLIIVGYGAMQWWTCSTHTCVNRQRRHSVAAIGSLVKSQRADCWRVGALASRPHVEEGAAVRRRPERADAIDGPSAAYERHGEKSAPAEVLEDGCADLGQV
jgi:hypothetical protein